MFNKKMKVGGGKKRFNNKVQSEAAIGFIWIESDGGCSIADAGETLRMVKVRQMKEVKLQRRASKCNKNFHFTDTRSRLEMKMNEQDEF